MQNKTPTTIKEKLPKDFHLLSQPLFYCDIDDTLHLSRSAASYHWHSCNINKKSRAFIDARVLVEAKLMALREYKTKTLPSLQKSINSFSSRIKELLSTKDWESSFATHAAKRREILTLRFRRMEAVALLKEKIVEFSNLKKEYKEVKESFATLDKQLDEARKKAREAEEFWKKHKENDKT